jgi:prophage regulatory protein
MTPATSIRFLRIPQVEDRTGCKQSNIFNRVNDGTFPPAIKFGSASAWAEHEVDEILKAHMGGATEEQLRRLVRDQLKRRAAGLTATSAASVPA